MDDATQKLATSRAGEFDGDVSPEALSAWERYAALPARYGPWYEYREQDAFAAGYDAARRTPVSPEQRREEVAEADWRDCMRRRAVAGPSDLVAVAREYFLEGRGYGVEDATRSALPSQPVYDEEKIAEVIARALTGFDLHMQAGVPSHTYVGRYEAVQLSREAAAALVAALRGGELTREETNE